jgi:transcription termination factor Rho
MSVLDRASLEASPLADLHTIASELSIDGFRRLRKADLISAILDRQAGADLLSAAAEAEEEGSEEAEGKRLAASDTEEDEGAGARRRRGRRGGRGRGRAGGGEEAAEAPAEEPEQGRSPRRRSRSAGGEQSGRERGATAAEGRSAPAQDAEVAPQDDEGEAIVEGVVELLPNGSGFLRIAPPEVSDGDVYVSAAQIKRCELVAGDLVRGPRRAPRRSERFASLIRVDTVNGRPAAELTDRGRWEDLPLAFPSERFRIGSEDPTLKTIEWLTPFGRGSRVTIVGGAWAGKSWALRALAGALSADDGVQLLVALAGARPEEIADWESSPITPASAIAMTASAEAQEHALELVLDQARRVAARGADAVVLIDSLAALPVASARRLLGEARNLTDGGSLTIIAVAPAPLGGETTVIALDRAMTGTGRFPALDFAASGTLRAELLVGEAGAEAIMNARLEALGERRG